MPKHIIDMISTTLNEYQKSINGSKILIIGVAYKKNIDDCRESPALDIIELLTKYNSEVQYYDKYIPVLNFNNIKLKSLESLEQDHLQEYDSFVILTDHSEVDYELLLQSEVPIIDTRNVYKNVRNKKIVRLGQG